MLPRTCWVLGVFLSLSLIGQTRSQQGDFSAAAQAFRGGQPVRPISETTILCEAEEFQTDGKGWQAKPFGTNYYAATFANSFLSRQAYLGALPQADKAAAHVEIEVPKPGKYLALVRYEAPFRFEAQFRLIVEQHGQKVLDRLYGSRDNLRIWAFREKLKKEVAWSWGAVENMVWEGHDAEVTLQPGKAKLTLIADKQPEPAGKRNVDLVMLTSDLEQVKMRIDKENFLPLDGMLTQAEDVFVKVRNRLEKQELSLTIPNGTEHSPYWIHIRTWKPKTITAKPAQTTDWIEVGSLLDTLSPGQWNLTPVGKGPFHFDLEFGLKNADGTMRPLRRFEDLKGKVELAYDGDTRYSRRLRLVEEVLYDLVAYLKKHPVQGTAPKRTLVYGYTFAPNPDNPKYSAALDEFIKLMGATALGRNAVEDLTDQGLVRGYADVRGVPTAKLEDYCKKLQAEKRADRIAVVSLGDEIGLATPPAGDHKGFQSWLAGRNLKPAEIEPGTDSWDKVQWSAKPETAKTNPALYYHSKIYGYRYGIKNLKDRTDILKKHLPNAGIGANFSPHHKHMYLGDTHHWISLFREDGMTMPWGEDYIWQVPVGSQQMNFIMLDMYRAGLRNKPGAKIHYYVMPHTPGNTPRSWRRQFYGDLGHGAKVLNLFEFRPVQAAYTENHVSAPEMYQEVRKSLHELGQFEDIIQDGQIPPADVGLWFSETADVWDNHKAPLDVAKRSLYLALRHHAGIPLDFVVDGDDLSAYKVMYLCDANVSQAGSRGLAAWVQAGGRLFATAGAGLFDEYNRPNKILRDLLSVEPESLIQSKQVIQFEKQDLPFAEPLDTVTWQCSESSERKGSFPVFGLAGTFKAGQDAQVTGKFKNGRPAIVHRAVGKGSATYCGFLPGLTYLQKALPKIPVDRGATDDSSAHFLPTDFEMSARALVGAPLANIKPQISCAPLTEAMIIRSKQGVVIPLVNWDKAALKSQTLVVHVPVPTKSIRLASGRPIQVESKAGGAVSVRFDLGVADALIFRDKE